MPDRLQRFTMTGRQKSTDVHCTTKYDRLPRIGRPVIFCKNGRIPIGQNHKTTVGRHILSCPTQSTPQSSIGLISEILKLESIQTPEIHNSNPQKPTSSSRPTDPSPQQILLPHAVIISSCHNFFCKKLHFNLVYKINRFIFAMTKGLTKARRSVPLRQQNFKTT